MRIIALGALLLTACGGPSGIGSTLPDPHAEVDLGPREPRPLHGQVSFDARREAPRGASRTFHTLTAPFVQVRAVTQGGEVIADTRTDAEGHYRLDATTHAARLEVVAHVQHGPHDLAVTTDGGGTTPHTFPVGLAELSGDELDIHVADSHASSGALHILEVIHRGAEAVRTWTGRTLPPFFIYWSRGVTTDWSFYFGERPSESGRYGVELLGGEPGRRSVTDTDEHDEAIILHEFGHFVMDRLSTDSSPGGSHPSGTMLDPGLAWEEGRATWFALAVLGHPRYMDTIGLEPTGQMRVNHDIERGREGSFLTGMGSEQTVSEVLWDLADGPASSGPTLPDRDADGVALGPGVVLEAMVELSTVPGAYPALPTLLRHLVDSGRVSEETLVRMLQIGRQDIALLPPPGGEPWPRELTMAHAVGGKIDGLTNPAPSGGAARPSNGIDAVHSYRFEAPRDGWYTIRLQILGSGSPADRQDIDIELRDLRADQIARSIGEGPSERIHQRLEAGWYIVVVRDGGQGNRADYRLELSGP